MEIWFLISSETLIIRGSYERKFSDRTMSFQICGESPGEFSKALAAK